jgi:hypothetical protein
MPEISVGCLTGREEWQGSSELSTSKPNGALGRRLCACSRLAEPCVSGAQAAINLIGESRSRKHVQKSWIIMDLELGGK